jgi:hypothetical protein
MSWTEGTPRTLRDVVSDVWLDSSRLAQQHLELASQEVAERTAGLSVDLAASLGATALLHGSVLALLASAGFGLHAAGFSPWLATLIVAVGAMAIGFGMALWARARLARRTTSHSETLLALGETSDWIAASLRGDRS